MAVEPKPERMPIEDEVKGLRTELAGAGTTIKRTLWRIGWARLIIVAAAQIVIALVAWRISVRRERRARILIQHVLERQPPIDGAD